MDACSNGTFYRIDRIVGNNSKDRHNLCGQNLAWANATLLFGWCVDYRLVTWLLRSIFTRPAMPILLTVTLVVLRWRENLEERAWWLWIWWLWRSLWICIAVSTNMVAIVWKLWVDSGELSNQWMELKCTSARSAPFMVQKKDLMSTADSMTLLMIWGSNSWGLLLNGSVLDSVYLMRWCSLTSRQIKDDQGQMIGWTGQKEHVQH